MHQRPRPAPWQTPYSRPPLPITPRGRPKPIGLILHQCCGSRDPDFAALNPSYGHGAHVLWRNPGCGLAVCAKRTQAISHGSCRLGEIFDAIHTKRRCHRILCNGRHCPCGCPLSDEARAHWKSTADFRESEARDWALGHHHRGLDICSTTDVASVGRFPFDLIVKRVARCNTSSQGSKAGLRPPFFAAKDADAKRRLCAERSETGGVERGEGPRDCRVSEFPPGFASLNHSPLRGGIIELWDALSERR
jgi:hypothetical protein